MDYFGLLKAVTVCLTLSYAVFLGVCGWIVYVCQGDSGETPFPAVLCILFSIFFEPAAFLVSLVFYLVTASFGAYASTRGFKNLFVKVFAVLISAIFGIASLAAISPFYQRNLPLALYVSTGCCGVCMLLQSVLESRLPVGSKKLEEQPKEGFYYALVPIVYVNE